MAKQINLELPSSGPLSPREATPSLVLVGAKRKQQRKHDDVVEPIMKKTAKDKADADALLNDLLKKREAFKKAE